MPVSAILPLLFIAATFYFLPFQGESRLFSMPVQAEWLSSSQAKQTRRAYQIAVILVTVICAGMVLLAGSHPQLSFAAPAVEVGGVVAAWRWGWSRTLPFRLQPSITRTADLRPEPAKQLAQWWSFAALLPILGTGLLLASRYGAIPASFVNHVGADGAPSHIVAKSWPSVYGPLATGAISVVLLAGILRAIHKHGAGVADRGSYSAWTGRFVVGVTWMVALECSAVALLPIVPHGSTYAANLAECSAVAAAMLLLVSAGVLVGRNSLLISGQSATDAAYWKGGLFYFNRDDAALFVPKRLGFGWTLNMARPAAWVLMALILVIPLLGRALSRF